MTERLHRLLTSGNRRRILCRREKWKGRTQHLQLRHHRYSPSFADFALGTNQDYLSPLS